MSSEPTTLATWTQALHDEEMPIFSNTARKIQSILTDDKKGAMELASVVMQDPNLTAKLLKMGNSSYYNPSGQKMLTVSRSIVILGSETIRELTLACSFFEAILSQKNKDKANEEIATAIHAAVQAKSLAILSQDESPEEVFIAALLHNIGDISFWCFSEQQGERIQALMQAGQTQQAAEQDVLGFKLHELTTSLCQSWQLGGLIAAAIKQVKNNRTELVKLSHEIVQASQSGWHSDSMNKCLSALTKISNKPIKVLTDTLQNNTKIAVKIARQFGAHDASHFIQNNSIQRDDTLESQEQPLPTTSKKQLQFHILQDISNLLSADINLNLLFETVMEGIHRGIGMDRSCFMLATPNNNRLNEKFSFGWKKDNIPQKISFILTSNPPNLFYYASQSNTGLWATPAHHQAYYSTHIINTIGKVECFLLPLYSHNKFIGLVYTDRALTHEPLTQEDFNVAKHFTQQASLGLNLYRANR